MARRKLTDEELAGVDQYLQSGKTLDEFVSDKGLDRAEVDAALADTGLTLPGGGLKLADDPRNLYLDVLRGNNNLWKSSQTFGFDIDAALQGLSDTGLNVPLNPTENNVYESALASGLSAEDAADRFDVAPEFITQALAGAGLNPLVSKPGASGPDTLEIDDDPVVAPSELSDTDTVTGNTDTLGDTTKSTVDATVTAGARGINDTLANAFNFVPQARGMKLGKPKSTKFKSDDPTYTGKTDTILTSGRGLTDPANTSPKVLLGS